MVQLTRVKLNPLIDKVVGTVDAIRFICLSKDSAMYPGIKEMDLIISEYYPDKTTLTVNNKMLGIGSSYSKKTDGWLMLGKI